MLPTATAPVLTRPHLPIPPIIRRPSEQSFFRPRNLFQDFTFQSPIVTETFRPQATIRNDSESSRNIDYNQENIVGQQNKQRLCQQEENRFQNNQEGNNHLGQPQHQQRRPLNEEGIGGNRSFQPNGSIINTRIPSDPLAPATDVYSHLNRLSELFPDIHPSQLQRVFDDCGRDILRTIDNVLYARRFRKSILAHISKYRSFIHSHTPKNLIANSQQQKERNSEEIVKNSQPPQPETRIRNSPKSRRLTRSDSGQQSKRHRLLAFTTPNTQQDSNKGEEQITPSTSQSYTSFSRSTPLTQPVKKPSPPPNVFFQPVANDLQQPGNGNSNPRYMISLKRPHTLHYGAPPSISSNLTLPLVLDNSFFHNTLPPPMVRYPVLDTSGIVNNSSLRTPDPADQLFLESTQEQQQQQPPHQHLEQIEQVQPTQRELQMEHEIPKETEQMGGASISQATDLSFQNEQFEIVQQDNEVETWSNLIKTFCEPLQSEDIEENSLMMELIPSSQSDKNELNETSHECGHYLQVSQETGDGVDQNSQGEVEKDLNASRSSESMSGENDGKGRDAIQREDHSPQVRKSMIRKRKSMEYQSDTSKEKRSMDDIPTDVVRKGNKANI